MAEKKASTKAPKPGAAPKPTADDAENAEPKSSAPSAKSAVPSEPKPAVPAQPVAPPPPPAKPTGDAAMLYGAVGGTYAVLEDGAGVLTVSSDVLLDAVAEARAMGYRILSLLSAYDRVDHYGVLYALVKPASKPEEFGELRLRVMMPKKDAAGAAIEPRCPSLVPILPAAEWQEREMYDMYGIQFEGHPDLRRMFLPEGWRGYPMRKDTKEPEQYVAMRDGEDIVVSKPEEGAW